MKTKKPRKNITASLNEQEQKMFDLVKKELIFQNQHLPVDYFTDSLVMKTCIDSFLHYLLEAKL